VPGTCRNPQPQAFKESGSTADSSDEGLTGMRTNSIDDLLEQMVARSASDLHVSVGSCPAIRVHGQVERLEDYDVLTQEDTQQLMYQILSSEQQKNFEIKRQLDFAHGVPGLARFRVNVYFQRGSVGAAFRLIPEAIKTLEELGLPASLHTLAEKPRGLVLVTGPTGSGKSTTLASLIDEVNRTRAEHILTIEDPIEFVHRHKRCIVNQREIGVDAPSFAEGLRAALRQDPDVILVGEMRDLETIATALTAAETGHLVLGTLHTQSASSTVDRIIDVFSPEQQEQVRMQIAGSLQGIITQALLPTAAGTGRVPALEILLPDDATRNLIRQGKVEQIYTIMQTSTQRGMQTMEQALAELTLRHVVTLDAALARSSRPDQLLGLLERAGYDTSAAYSEPEQPPEPLQPLGAGLRVAEG
jgi:twitching motility protein PilT